MQKNIVRRMLLGLVGMFLLAGLLVNTGATAPKASPSASGTWMWGYIVVQFKCPDSKKKGQKFVSDLFKWCYSYADNITAQGIAEECVKSNDVTEPAKVYCGDYASVVYVRGAMANTEEQAEQGRQRELRSTDYGHSETHSFFSSCAASKYYRNCK